MAEIIKVGFGENTGTTAADSSGNGRDVTSVPGWTASQSGHGAAMSRSTAGTGGQFTLASDLTEWTLMMWVKARSTASYASIMQGPDFYLEINGLTLDCYHSANAIESYIDYAGVLSSDTWTHVAYTYNATTNATRVVVNGTMPAGATRTADNLVLKAYTYNLGGSADRPGNMDIDDFRVFDVGMTDSEIAAIMGESVGPAEPVALWGGIPARSSLRGGRPA